MTPVATRLSDSLDAPVQFLRGIGPRRAKALEKHGVRTVLDLLYYVPRRYLDRTSMVKIGELRKLVFRGQSDREPSDVTVVGEVRSFKTIGFGAKSRLVLVLTDDTGSLQCVWFGGIRYWENRFKVGETLAVSGQPGVYGNIVQFVHPDLDRISGAPTDTEDDAGLEEIDWSRTLNTGGLVPLYPSGQDLERVGLHSAGFRRVIFSAIEACLDAVKESLPGELLSLHRLLSLRVAIRSVHFPKTHQELAESLRRLKYDEFFYFQLKLALKRHHFKQNLGGIAFNVESKLARQLVDSLPFTLTRAQIHVINEITADMKSAKPMNRLLQGDVGSGKTVVALIAMLIAVENGYQAVFMAPTEILAEQHYKTIDALLENIPVNVRLLVGAQRSKLRRDVLGDVHRGSAQIVVGTHALFEKEVEFAKLGLIVIDEQHRFGVLQRAALQKKGGSPDVLVMTATPIPRTLSLTLYGDLDVSIINELPRNRKSIKTLLRTDLEKEEVYKFVGEQIRQGRQVYFVYPLIEESEKLDLKAATVHFEHLQKSVFSSLRLGLLHGRMSSDEKDAVMMAFKNGQLDILVATTVIEVGIDVPNASVMVIENAERFGLSQLHQLRGRVGRGGEQSYCILLAKKWIVHKAGRLAGTRSAAHAAIAEQRQAERRLATMVSTTDGFKIAEVDLEIRGPGDYFGTRQSGIPEFRVGNILTDAKILETARRDAFSMFAQDPSLSSGEHRMMAEQLRAHHRDSISLLHIA